MLNQRTPGRMPAKMKKNIVKEVLKRKPVPEVAKKYRASVMSICRVIEASGYEKQWVPKTGKY